MNEDKTLCPEVPGPRYIINKSMAWLLITATAVAGFAVGFFIGILALTT